jgi:hypothetical protein
MFQLYTLLILLFVKTVLRVGLLHSPIKDASNCQLDLALKDSIPDLYHIRLDRAKFCENIILLKLV